MGSLVRWAARVAWLADAEQEMKRDLFDGKTPEKEKQMEMARNIGQLKSKGAKRQQAHVLCQSLIRMLKVK